MKTDEIVAGHTDVDGVLVETRQACSCPHTDAFGCVVNDLSEHPFRFYLKEGLRVCLNTDNTLFARTSPLRELRLAVDTFDLTLLETENLLINGFKSAFLPENAKGEMVLEALQTFTSLRDKFDLDHIKAAKP